MNESAGDQISQLLSGDLHPSVTDDLDPADDSDDEPRVRTSREGLPGSFRMRHDAHYVDELMSRPAVGVDRGEPSRRRGEPAPVKAHPDKPATVAANITAEERPTSASALSLIASRLESIAIHAGALRPHHTTPPLIAESVQAEFARAARLARAAAVLAEAATPRRHSLSAGAIAERVMTASRPVARMGGLSCEVIVDDPAFTIVAEATLVLQAVAGTVDAVVDLLLTDQHRRSLTDGGDPDARMSISLHSVKVRPALIVDVICPSLFVGSRLAECFFDNVEREYRLAPTAGILLAASARIARAHGGRADLKRHNGMGPTITYVFPQTVADHSLA